MPVVKSAKNAPNKTVEVPEAMAEYVDIEVALYERLHVYGRMWVSGQKYKVAASLAKDLLALAEEGKPLFLRWRDEAVATEPVDEAVVVEAPKAPEPAAPARIDVTSKEEEAELGLPPADPEPDSNDVVKL